MPLLSRKEVLNLKLKSISLPQLRELADKLRVDSSGPVATLIKRMMEQSAIEEFSINSFIKEKYAERIRERRNLITDDELKQELMKVQNFSWGIVQGQLDQKIQREYVRKFVRYDELIGNVKNHLHNEITSYVICTWFNHWTTVLIEEHISQHPKVVPTLKNIKGVDIFFNGQPFDLKTTYVPKNYNIDEAIKNPKELAIWMYEKQGAQRCGADNRLFVILLDKENLEASWKLKRNFDLVFKAIDNFFDTASLSTKDEIIFVFKKKTYTTISKILIIVK